VEVAYSADELVEVALESASASKVLVVVVDPSRSKLTQGLHEKRQE